MENYKKRIRLPIALMIALAMVLGLGAAPVFAAAPYKEDVNYLGKGRVEVEFDDDARYKNVRVTVKDSSGKKYKAGVYRKNEDELRFKVKKYKAGKTYRFTIKGVRAEHTSGYGKVTGKFKIEKASSKKVTADKAKAIAFKHAGVSASEVSRLHVHKERDDGRLVYEIDFRAGGYEYDYVIAVNNGKILEWDKDWDDDWHDDWDY